MERQKGFTLIELMVVILIVSILAGVAIPLMQGRIDTAKWSEGNATAGTIRTAIRAYYAQNPTAASALSGDLGVATTRDVLGFGSADLTGTYFVPSNYTITSINSSTGIAVITVSAGTGLTGSYILQSNGDWVKQAAS
jgi:prepilin-type N-terminal cleavage/methylation domain-containing protein